MSGEESGHVPPPDKAATPTEAQDDASVEHVEAEDVSPSGVQPEPTTTHAADAAGDEPDSGAPASDSVQSSSNAIDENQLDGLETPAGMESDELEPSPVAATADTTTADTEERTTTNDDTEASFEDVSMASRVNLPLEVEAEPAVQVTTDPAPVSLSDAAPPTLPPKSPEVTPAASRHSSSASVSRSNTVASSSMAPRRSSVGSTTTISATGSSSLVSGVLIISALEQIAATKEAKKSKALSDSLQDAITALKNPVASTSAPSAADGVVDPHVIFTPLRLACETKSLPLMIIALDCIGKLVSYDFFVERNPQPAQETNDDGEPTKPNSAPALADVVTNTVCECFSPSSAATSSSASASSATTQHDTLLLRLLSALLSLILSSTLAVHQSSLLKAVRTVYNVFLMGRPGTVQTVAQATLGQIVGGVFGRVALGEAAKLHNLNGSRESNSATASASASRRQSATDLTSIVEEEPESAKETEQPSENDAQAENEGNEEEKEAAGQTTPRLGTSGPASEASPPRSEKGSPDQKKRQTNGVPNPVMSSALLGNSSTDSLMLEGIESKTTATSFMTTNDLYVKDAFLVFRALCKLSMKPLGAENERDIKSHAMRSKLLSLHLIQQVLNNHLAIFTDPHVGILSSSTRERTPFLQATKQYLCLALSRNAVSPVIQVFELSCEIFWRVLSGLRFKLKKEIEVLLNEIFLPILEMRNSTVLQKNILLAVFGRIAQDPQALVDIYLNYDCDRSSLDNIYERLINIVSKLSTTNFPPASERQSTASKNAASAAAKDSVQNAFPTTGASLTDDSRLNDPAFASYTPEALLKRQSLECLVAVLKSLVSWAGRGTVVQSNGLSRSGSTPSLINGQNGAEDASRLRSDSEPPTAAPIAVPPVSSPHLGNSGRATPDVVPADDPSRFESAKQRKTTLLEGIKKFNFKPKRGIDFLIETGFIRSTEPKDIARFLLHADGLDKAQIGEYLGEGDAHNIATMHAFVDFMDFTNLGFVDALRMFLQSFRLPGEAQKIDRYMLKFAERYTAGNPGKFANADTAYILAFSVILLNTDAHNPQVKKPMSKTEFIKNNRGIDDGKDLPEDSLSSIYDEITSNEIRMKDEVEAAGPQAGASGLAGAIATVGRDLQREAYIWQSEGMANKTEALFRTLVRSQRRGAGQAEQFYVASHFEHVKPMFEVVWMPILAGISAPLQTSDEMAEITLSLDGFKQAIKIVCLFDLELERNAFVTTLAKFTFLNNFGEMKAKNVEAIKTLLDIAMVDGNYLKGSWREVLTCVSQLERFQLIAQGVDSQTVPELGRKPTMTRDRRSTISKARSNRPTQEVAHETRSQHITITADMIFSSTPQLSGTAIVDFVQALSDVSWEEIQSSGLAEQPRVFSLQKLVEISYYNMNRIRLEWSQIWTILGEHFNQVTCHSNAKVSFLALDSLRQLAMRFLEKEELANFKFQKDFLKPFEYAMTHNNNNDARDMVLQCLHQMIQARVQNLRSGWRTMFGVFSAASKIPSERIAVQAFEIVQRVNKEHFDRIIAYGSFADLTVCITDFCKISKYQRASLQAIEMLKDVIPMMLECPECPLSPAAGGVVRVEPSATDDPMLRFWFPILFGFYDVIMNGEDMEVRKRALDYLFETLKRHGRAFPAEFWDTVCKEVLFPIFAVLRSRHDVSRFSTQEDMSVWLSTTMIQALRNLVDLFTFYFDVLARMLDRLLDLLCECICQENDTLARIGTSCLQQLVESNVEKLSPERWQKVVATFVQLFETTTAHQLFDDRLLEPTADTIPSAADLAPANGLIAPAPLTPARPPRAEKKAEGAAESQAGSEEKEDGEAEAQAKADEPIDRRRTFRQIIVKCVLQLLLIETTHELLQNERVYTTIPPDELLKLMNALDASYRFARSFNADKDLRMALWKVGFMRDLPNLLRQESTSARTLVNVLLRMYNNTDAAHLEKREEVVRVFAPLGVDVLSNYVSFNPETQARNIAAWTPVVGEILQGFCSFEDEAFMKQLGQLYPLVTNALLRDLEPNVRNLLRDFYIRVGRTALKL